jgi:hypothetical protein
MPDASKGSTGLKKPKTEARNPKPEARNPNASNPFKKYQPT